MRLSSALWLVSLWGVLGLARCEERLVRTASGPVLGHKESGDNIYTFYGIPYATAPTGPRRFKAPLPAPTWIEPIDAVNNDIVCPQATIDGQPSTTDGKVVREDCLIANFYVPDTDEKYLPVVVYVHGGAFQVGYGNMLPPDELARTKRVIAVNFNYRLGIHGFLCLGTSEAPGNAGMKDQVALLRWVNENIANFGGNPDDVSIAGFSAGSAAVHLLMLSPTVQGLFNKIVLDSGANISPWAVQIDPFENAKYFAEFKGLDEINNVYDIENFYTSASIDLITSTGGFWDRTDASFLFSPCVETNTDEEPFLTDSPYNILKSGNYSKVPILFGLTDMEGLIRIDKFDTWKEKMNANFSNFLPIDLKFETEAERNDVAQNIKEFYFGNEEITNDSVLSYIDYITDTYFAASTLRAVRLHAEAGLDKIYLYEYSYVDNSTPPVPHTDNVRGADHCAQTFAILGVIPNDLEEFKKMQSVLRELWLNFMTKGTPVPPGSSLPAWPATGADGSPHMSLDHTLELRGALLEERVRFWDDVYERHYRAPQPPPTPPPRPSSGSRIQLSHLSFLVTGLLVLSYAGQHFLQDK